MVLQIDHQLHDAKFIKFFLTFFYHIMPKAKGNFWLEYEVIIDTSNGKEKYKYR